MTTETNGSTGDPPREQIYEIVENSELSLEEKQRSILDVGREYLNLSNAYIQSHASDSTTDEILVSVGEDPELFPEGEEIDRARSYCRRTVEETSPVALSNAPAQGWEDDPAYKEHDASCYLGTTLYVGGEIYGTVCFVQRGERQREFSTEELLFVELVARLLAREIELARAEQFREQKDALQTELEKTTRGTLQLASELEQRYQRLFDSAVEGIYTTTEELDEYVIANPAFANLLGYESGEEVCSEVDSIESDVFVEADIYAEYTDRLTSEGKLDQFEYRVKTVDGDQRWVSDSVTTLTDEEGDIDGYRGAVIDITEQKKQERDLKRQTNLSIVLNRVLRHNLRNDMTVIRGTTQVMADEMDDESVGERALNNIDKLLRLSEKARELDEIVASDTEPQPTDIQVVVTGVVTQVRREHPSASISVQADEKVTATVLPSFERAIRELVNNAAKHGGESPTVEVTVRRVSDRVEIEIADDGPGLGDQEISVLRSGTETPLMHGSGIGLWLANWIVSSNEGSIDATVTDEGTTLTVTVPTTPQPGIQQQVVEINRARDQYKAAFEEAGDGMTITDENARILDLNDEAARIYGLEKRKLLGRSITEFLPEDFDFEAEWSEFEENEMKQDELNIIGADGSVTPISYTAKSHIVPGQHLFITRDITHRKEREQQLELAETIFQNTQDAMFLIDVEDGEFRIQRVNEGFETVTGLESEEIAGKTPRELLGEETGGGIETRYRECVAAGETIRYEEKIPVDGEQRFWETKLTPVISDGKITKLVGAIRDITERKEREQQLETLNQRLQLALEGTDTGVWEWKIETDELVWSESMERLFGLEPGTFDGTLEAFLERVHPDDRQNLEDAIQASVDGNEKFHMEYRIQGDSGRQRWIDGQGDIQESSDGSRKMIGIVTDITDLKERNRELSKLKQRYETLLQAAPDPVFVADGETGEILEVNEAAESMIGMSREEIVGMHQSDLHPSDQAERYRKLFEESVQYDETKLEIPGGSPVYVVTADGERVPVDLTATTVSLPDETVVYGVFRDISDRLERERELREKNRQLEAIVENTSEAIYIKDTDGQYLFINESGAELFGRSVEEVIGKTDEDLFDAESAAKIRSADGRVIESGNEVSEETVRYIDGEKHVFLDNKYPYRDEDGEILGIIGISPDISER